ncbi:MAG TPA: superoxide dismutase [Polyangia bacterium]|jgi:Fe-Mn family superoxide dismutase|nr:superoxide dismutase [Polyangia bacterium]
MNKYTLPDLDYDFGALEPHISGRIMELHHEKHHAAYVKGANEATEALFEAREKNDFTKIASLQRALAFNLSGHVLHSIFWKNLAPKRGGQPSGPLATAIDSAFGNFDHFKSQLVEAAMTTSGSGWAALSWEPLGQRLITTQIHDHQSEFTAGSSPLLVLDAWEHAYYLQYGPDKKSFFQGVFNLWNWDDVAARFESARALNLGLGGKKSR